MTVNFSEALRYPRLDPEWKTKILLAIALMFVPVLNFAVTGYTVRIVQEVRAGRRMLLPRWDDLGGHFMLGGKLGLATLLLMLPIMIPFLVGYFVLMFFLITSSGAGGRNAPPQIPGWAWAVFAVCALIYIAGLLIYVLVGPALTMQFARHETFASCFKFGDMRAIMQKHGGAYARLAFAPVLVALAFYAVFFCAMFNPITGVLFSLFPIVLLPFIYAGVIYGMFVMAHAYGQYESAPALPA